MAGLGLVHSLYRAHRAVVPATAWHLVINLVWFGMYFVTVEVTYLSDDCNPLPRGIGPFIVYNRKTNF